MGGIYWDVLGETGVYSQQCQYQKNVLIGCLCFFIVFWHVFKNKSKTKLLNPCPKPLTFPQGYLFFLGFYMVSNGTRDLKQAETTTNKFAMPKGGKVAKS